MGFGFNLFGFPLLLLATAGLIIYAVAKQSWKPLLVVAGLWGLTILMFALASIADYNRKPIRLTRQDVIGEYHIDTNFFSGANARWQYDHYKFYITNNDSILFTVSNDKGVPQKLYRHKVTYSGGQPTLWKISADTTHHIIRQQPTLYRGHNKFYYVFRSDKYGNMFFRKNQND
jgi:ABC-type transport system involved in multi-copper enzyme maturation permease subunit